MQSEVCFRDPAFQQSHNMEVKALLRSCQSSNKFVLGGVPFKRQFDGNLEMMRLESTLFCTPILRLGAVSCYWGQFL